MGPEHLQRVCVCVVSIGPKDTSTEHMLLIPFYMGRNRLREGLGLGLAPAAQRWSPCSFRDAAPPLSKSTCPEFISRVRRPGSREAKSS